MPDTNYTNMKWDSNGNTIYTDLVYDANGEGLRLKAIILMTVHFRARSVETGEWVYGYYACDNHTGHQIVTDTCDVISIYRESLEMTKYILKDGIRVWTYVPIDDIINNY